MTVTIPAETDREREVRLAVGRAREILVSEGIPAAVAFLQATSEYLRRWFDEPADAVAHVGTGALPASNWPVDAPVALTARVPDSDTVVASTDARRWELEDGYAPALPALNLPERPIRLYRWRRKATTLAVLPFLLAFGGHNIPRTHHATPAPICHASIENGALTVSAVNASYDGAPVDATVRNHAGTLYADLAGRISSGFWTHRVWPTYTSANIVVATVDGQRCQVV